MTNETIQQEPTEVATKVKKLKLKPFEYTLVDFVHVTLQKFYVEDEDEYGYGAVLVLELSTAKREGFPILMHLPIAGPCYTQVAHAALELAFSMCENVGETIQVFEEDQELFTLEISDVYDAFDSCDECQEGV